MDLNVAYVAIAALILTAAIVALFKFPRAEISARLPFRTELKIKGTRESEYGSHDLVAEQARARDGSIRADNSAGGSLFGRRLDAKEDIELKNRSEVAQHPKAKKSPSV